MGIGIVKFDFGGGFGLYFGFNGCLFLLLTSEAKNKSLIHIQRDFGIIHEGFSAPQPQSSS